MKIHELKPGDLLLYRIDLKAGGFKHWVSKLIGFFQPCIGEAGTLKTTYSHIAMVDSDINYLLESTWPVARRVLIEIPESPVTIDVFRVKNAEEISSGAKRADIAIDWAHKHLGTHYDILMLLSMGLIDVHNQEVCSMYASKAWQSAGDILSVEGKKDKLISPNEIAMNLNALDKLSPLEA
jgi:hypothetical protein